MYTYIYRRVTFDQLHVARAALEAVNVYPTER